MPVFLFSQQGFPGGAHKFFSVSLFRLQRFSLCLGAFVPGIRATRYWLLITEYWLPWLRPEAAPSVRWCLRWRSSR